MSCCLLFISASYFISTTTSLSQWLFRCMTLQNMTFEPVQHTSSIELSRTAFLLNVAFVRKLISSGTEISAVLKGNAYGHGLEQLTDLCLEAGLRHLSVFSAHEASRILKHTHKPVTIMIMGMIDERDLPWAIANEIEFFVFEIERLKAAAAAAREVGKKARIHLEVETGMNRTGFAEKDLIPVVDFLKQHTLELELVSLCTHFAGAEEVANDVRIRQQLQRYNALHQWFTMVGAPPLLRHTACSAATLNYPETRMDLVRIGIMFYGFWPNMETRMQHIDQHSQQQDPLQRIITWKSKVMSIKQIAAGEYIGYGASYQAASDMLIASVPVGYAYGFSRSLSNTGSVLIGCQRVPVIGVVNMNLMMVDITAVEVVQKGDEVVLIGRQGEQVITVSSFSEMSQQLNYEMLTRLPVDIPRTIVD